MTSFLTSFRPIIYYLPHLFVKHEKKKINIIYHFFDTKTKERFDSLEVSIMQARLSVSDYENYVSISGQIKFPKKVEDVISDDD